MINVTSKKELIVDHDPCVIAMVQIAMNLHHRQPPDRQPNAIK